MAAYPADGLPDLWSAGPWSTDPRNPHLRGPDSDAPPASIVDGHIVFGGSVLPLDTLHEVTALAPTKFEPGWIKLSSRARSAQIDFSWPDRHRMRALAHSLAPGSTRLWQQRSGPSFVALDVETANQMRGSICAVGFAIVKDGAVVDNHAMLCQPPEGLRHFAPINIGIHGITPKMVADAPSFADCLDVLLMVTRDQPLICHNAAFDINAVREACGAEQRTSPAMTYGCTVKWARADLPHLPNHKLPTVAAHCGATLERHHEAAADALAAAQIMLALMRARGSGSLTEYARDTGIALGHSPATDLAAPASAWPHTRPQVSQPQPTAARGRSGWPTATAPPPQPAHNADRSHPLYGHTVVVSGDVGDLSRDEVWQELAAVGARPENNVTKRTTMLVVGPVAGVFRHSGKTQKQQRAEQLITQGQQLVIVTASQLLDLLA